MNETESKSKKKVLFCLPYAGGSAMIYSSWKKQVHPSIEVVPVELAGRGRRMKENLYNSMEEAIYDIYQQIKPYLHCSQYAFFGHSMGSLIAYELYYYLGKMGYKQPSHLFFSGKNPPHIHGLDKILHTLPDEEFSREVFDLGGTPEAILENKELMELFLPILRADFKIIETYNIPSRSQKLKCDISVLYGEKDSLIKGDINEWKMYAHGACSIQKFDGGHFFIHEKNQEVLKTINHTLAAY